MTNPFYYTDLGLTGISLSDASRFYTAWIFGEDVISQSRRHEEGVIAAWSTDFLKTDVDLQGDHDCFVQARISESEILLRFKHRQPSDPIILWTTNVKISKCPDSTGVRIQHGVWVSGYAPGIPVAAVGAPRVIERLMHLARGSITPKDAVLPVNTIADYEAEIDGFIEFALLDKSRLLPLILVSPNSSGLYKVEADVLRKHLVGVASVCSISSHNAALHLTDCLTRKGFQRAFGLSDGAVRAYMPNLQSTENPFSHPLWTGHRLSEIGNSLRSATEYVTRQIYQRVVPRSVPIGFYEHVESHDRARRAHEISVRRSAHEESAQAREWMDLALSENNKLTLEVRQLQQNLANREAEWQIQTESWQESIEAANEKATALQSALSRKAPSDAVTEASGVISNAEIECLRSLIAGERYTLVDLLYGIRSLYCERLIVLDSAIKSARESHDFLQMEAARDLIICLVTTYYESLKSGRPEQEAKAVFGGKYAATESGNIGKRGEALRTFVYRDESVTMLRHLKLGVGEQTANCLRIHFHWDAARSMVVIGHCGRHLDFK